MADIGTYGSTQFPFFPSNIIPEPGDPITWDWMECAAQFSQRFLKMATIIGTINNGLGQTLSFNYAALRCDFFPPYIQVHVRRFDPVSQTFGSTWEVYDPRADFVTYTSDGDTKAKLSYYSVFDVGLATCQIRSNMNQTRVFRVTAYL